MDCEGVVAGVDEYKTMYAMWLREYDHWVEKRSTRQPRDRRAWPSCVGLCHVDPAGV